ncbi:hypothetical protein GR157_34990 [Burkholderia sp. 4701]|nr:hypothetical protein [Burkholderia sp. 4701]MXN87179.1 hypothetical protein [Burkholderia sp. 4812]
MNVSWDMNKVSPAAAHALDVSLIARMKESEAENARLRKMYVEEKIKAEIVAEALAKKGASQETVEPWGALRNLAPDFMEVRGPNCSIARYFRHWVAGQAIGLSGWSGRRAIAARCRCT